MANFRLPNPPTTYGFGWANQYARVIEQAINQVSNSIDIANTWIGLEPINVKAAPYNAKGDGTTNDSGSFAAAITAAGTGGIIFMPPGNYLISTTLTLLTDQLLLGSGFASKLIVTSDGIGTLLSLTNTQAQFANLMIQSAIVSPTFTAVKVNTTSGGLIRADNVYIYGAGVGVNVIAGNACRFANMRVQNCPTGITTGGTNGSFPGDTTWQEIVVIPTTAGTGWIMDGNTNAQYLSHCLTIGGANGMLIRGSGASTSLPDGILMTFCNMTASSGSVLKITKGRNIKIGDTVIGGSTAGDGVEIAGASSTDIDGVMLEDCEIRANFQRGVNWSGGSNVQMMGGQIYGNSDGGGSGTFSNIFVGASATGLCSVVGVMAGLSSGGNVFANVQAPAKYGIELAAGALTNATNFPGRLRIQANELRGNTTGTLLDASAPVGSAKYIGDGQNPLAPAAVTPGASPWTYTAGSSPETAYINAGTVSAIAVAGVNVFTSTGKTVNLEPAQTLTLTYTVAPNFNIQVM